MQELKVGNKIKAERGIREFLGTIVEITETDYICRFYVPKGEIGGISKSKWKVTKVKNFKTA